MQDPAMPAGGKSKATGTRRQPTMGQTFGCVCVKMTMKDLPGGKELDENSLSVGHLIVVVGGETGDVGIDGSGSKCEDGGNGRELHCAVCVCIYFGVFGFGCLGFVCVWFSWFGFVVCVQSNAVRCSVVWWRDVKRNAVFLVVSWSGEVPCLSFRVCARKKHEVFRDEV